MSISIHYILIWCFQKCIFSRGEECKCRKKSSHNVHLLVLVHNISRLYVEVGDHNLVLAPTSILAVIYSSELEKVSLDFWSGVVVFLIRHHHVTFKSSELERYTFRTHTNWYISLKFKRSHHIAQKGRQRLVPPVNAYIRPYIHQITYSTTSIRLTTMIKSSMKSNRSIRDSSAGRRRPSNLSVGFDRRTRVYLVKSHHDYNDAEHDQIYQTKLDERRSHRDVVRCVTILRSGSDEERRAEDCCPRGLEKMQSTESILRAKAAKQRAIDAVLDEQDRQWEGNLNDTGLIADISARNSSNAVEIALLRAESDAAFARIYNPSPRDTDEKSEPSKCRPRSPPSTSMSSDDVSDRSDSSQSSSQKRSMIVQNALTKVLSSPDLTSISTNMATMSKARQHGHISPTQATVLGGKKTRNAPGA